MIFNQSKVLMFYTSILTTCIETFSLEETRAALVAYRMCYIQMCWEGIGKRHVGRMMALLVCCCSFTVHSENWGFDTTVFLNCNRKSGIIHLTVLCDKAI